MSNNRDPRIDAYIRSAAPFAQPILTHLRQLVHAGCPAVSETMKWSFPHFEYAGGILCSMAGFKAHCAFGFWHKGMEEILRQDGIEGKSAMGGFGRITSLADLPRDTAMRRYVKAAAKLNASGEPGRPRPSGVGKAKEPPIPADLATALKKNRTAAKTFADFRPSHRKEYIEWITEARRPQTREQRLATTLEWLAEGKPRHWKYQDC